MNIAIIVALFTLIFTRLLGMPHDALSLPSGFFLHLPGGYLSTSHLNRRTSTTQMSEGIANLT
jgi:hypothetical protein